MTKIDRLLQSNSNNNSKNHNKSITTPIVDFYTNTVKYNFNTKPTQNNNIITVDNNKNLSKDIFVNLSRVDPHTICSTIENNFRVSNKNTVLVDKLRTKIVTKTSVKRENT